MKKHSRAMFGPVIFAFAAGLAPVHTVQAAAAAAQPAGPSILLAKLLVPKKPANSSGGTSSGSGSSGAPINSELAAPDLASATVVVNAGLDVSESGGNDAAFARALFRSASYPESNGGLESSAALLGGLGATYSRTINAESGSSLDGSGNFVPSDRLNWNLPWIKRYGLNAHVVVGQRQPAFLATPGYQWTSAQWATYADYAYKLVRFVALQFDSTGFPETLFEVGNEVDITQNVQDLWTLANPAVPQGDEARYQHYLRVFAVWSRAVDRVARENPGRVIRVAGPAMGGQSLFLSSAFWHERFIQDVAAQGLRLDVVSHHFYGDLLNGWANVPGSALRAQLQRIRRALVNAGRGGTPIAITEYGPSEGSDPVFGKINYAHPGAAWAAMFVNEALAGTASAGSYFLVRDNFGADTTGNPGVASFDYIAGGIDYPKPSSNAFRMYTLLPGTRKSVTTSTQQPDVRAFATADGASAGLIVYNYHYRFNYPSDYTDLTTSQSVVPAFSNLPFNGTVTVERYLVDQDTSNVARFIDASQTPDLTASRLTRIEQCSASVAQGKLLLPSRTLGPSAVSLWLVKSGGGAGLAACSGTTTASSGSTSLPALTAPANGGSTSTTGNTSTSGSTSTSTGNTSTTTGSTTTTGTGASLGAQLAALAPNSALALGAYNPPQLTGCSNAGGITDYSRFTYDSINRQVLMFGGGHATTPRTDVDVLDLSNFTWGSAYASTPVAQMTVANFDATNGGWISTGQPLARHSYDLLSFAANTGELILLQPVSTQPNCMAVYDWEHHVGKIWHYKPQTRQWRPSAAAPLWSSFPSSEYDPVSGKIVLIEAYGLYTYDPVTQVAVKHQDFARDIGIAQNLVYFPPNDKMYYMVNNGVVYEVTLDRTNFAQSTIVQVSGVTGTPRNGPETGWAYDPVNRIIGGGVMNGVFYAFDPIAKAWTSSTIQSGAPVGDVVFHALDYDPVNNVFLFIGQVNGAKTTWAYRYGSGAAISAPGGSSSSSAATSQAPPPAVDSQAPSAPALLTANAVSSSEIDLSWAASSDNVGVRDYQVYRNGSAIATVSGTTYNDGSLAASTQYTYWIVAADARGNTSAASSHVSATTPQAAVATPAPGATGSSGAAITRVQLGEQPGDGPTWTLANNALPAEWKTPGGDWRDANDVPNGPTPGATATITEYATQPVSWEVGNLVTRLLRENTGFYIHPTQAMSAPPGASTREGANPPTLTVVTDKGTFNCPVIADGWMDPTTNQALGTQPQMKAPMLIKFDLSSVTGTVKSARLTITVNAIYSGTLPLTLAADYLDMPAIVTDPATQLGGVRYGLSSAVSSDPQLANNPNIIAYSQMLSEDQIRREWDFVNDDNGHVAPEVSFVTWSEYGIGAIRVASPLQRIISWHKWTEPKSNPPRPWQYDYGTGDNDGYQEMYMRYMLKIDPDVKDGMTELGVKLPGLAGTYEWHPSIPFPEASAWSARMEHGPVSAIHPNIYRLLVYWYGADNPVTSANRGFNRYTSVFLKAGQIYSIEQRVKLNTKVNGVWQSNGILQVWVDGVKVYEDLNVLVRTDSNVRIQDAPFANIYHGGMGVPKFPIHYEFSGVATSRQYIGPAIKIR